MAMLSNELIEAHRKAYESRPAKLPWVFDKKPSGPYEVDVMNDRFVGWLECAEYFNIDPKERTTKTE